MNNVELVEKTREVLKLQDSFNKVVNPNWQKSGYPFYRAAWLELAEFIEHIGTWKWWKKSTPGDREQAVLELVDVFHFVLSDAIIHRRNAETIIGAYRVAEGRKNKAPKNQDEYVFDEVEAFVEMMLTSVRTGSGIPLSSFFDVVVAYGVSYEELIAKYIGKNVLNKFRQDHGYKAGTYVKTWDSADNEDNFYLVKFRDDLGSSLTFDRLYDELRLKYQEVLESKNV